MATSGTMLIAGTLWLRLGLFLVTLWLCLGLFLVTLWLRLELCYGYAWDYAWDAMATPGPTLGRYGYVWDASSWHI